MKNKLTLKWGTLKAWDFKRTPEEFKVLFDRYNEIGSSASAMLQRDTPEQKEIICRMIDLADGKILLDWDMRYVSRREAKKYVMEYGIQS